MKPHYKALPYFLVNKNLPNFCIILLFRVLHLITAHVLSVSKLGYAREQLTLEELRAQHHHGSDARADVGGRRLPILVRRAGVHASTPESLPEQNAGRKLRLGSLRLRAGQ